MQGKTSDAVSCTIIQQKEFSVLRKYKEDFRSTAGISTSKRRII